MTIMKNNYSKIGFIITLFILIIILLYINNLQTERMDKETISLILEQEKDTTIVSKDSTEIITFKFEEK